MLIGLTGLHGAGKSYFCDTIPPEFGFKVFTKKKELAKVYKSKTGKDNWEEWYRNEYRKNPRKITEFIFSGIKTESNVIIDAIHSPIEWQIVKEMFPNAELAEIVTPEKIRLQRTPPLDIEKNKKRIEYWHSEGKCLLTEVEWSFNGSGSKELNEQSFKEFIEYIKDKEKKIDMLDKDLER